jgi:hypothetical protein
MEIISDSVADHQISLEMRDVTVPRCPVLILSYYSGHITSKIFTRYLYTKYDLRNVFT